MQLRCPWIVLLWLTLSHAALAAEVSVDRRTEKDVKRGPDIVRKTINVRIPFGSLRYSGIAREGSIRGIAEKYGDQVFGLSFNRPAATNGGWDLSSFLRVTVKVGQETFDGQRQFLLDDVYVLETAPRTVLQFVWPLSDAMPDPPKLIVTTIQYPVHRDWVFVDVQVKGAGASVTRVDLSCYPGNTAGPKERERWVATQHGTFELRDADVELAAGDVGVAYFNKLAQQNAGCFLVFDPHAMTSVKLSGTYGVRTRLAPRSPEQPIHLALGGYVNQDSEEAVRYFLQERADQMILFLKGIDWSPKIDQQEHEALLRDVKLLAGEQGDTTAARKLAELSETYRRAREANDTVRMIETVEAVKHIKETLIQQALKQLE